MGRSLCLLGRFTAAEDVYKEALQLVQTDWELWHSQGLVYTSLKMYDRSAAAPSRRGLGAARPCQQGNQHARQRQSSCTPAADMQPGCPHPADAACCKHALRLPAGCKASNCLAVLQHQAQLSATAACLLCGLGPHTLSAEVAWLQGKWGPAALCSNAPHTLATPAGLQGEVY